MSRPGQPAPVSGSRHPLARAAGRRPRLDGQRAGILMICLASLIFAVQDAVSRHLGAIYPPVYVTMLRYWFFAAVVLVIVSKLVNSQAAALVAIAPIGLQLGIDPAIIVGFYGAAYGYFILPTYPSDLACIGFDRTGTTHIGKFVINHSFLVPGAISVFTSCVVGSLLAQVLL